MFCAISVTIAITAFLVNSVLCVISGCCKNVRKKNNIFLVSHYIANILQSFTTTLYFVLPSTFGALLCVVNIFFSFSVLCVPVIALVTLVKTLWVTQRTALCSGILRFSLLAALFVVALGMAVPPFLGWGSPILHGIPSAISMSYSIFIAVTLSAAPLVIICLSNYKLFKRVRSYERRSRRQTEAQGKVPFDSRNREGEAKWIMLLQTVAFFVCLIPITVQNILSCVNPQIIPEVVKHLFSYLAQAYSLVSPLLHGLTRREVRHALRKCCCRQKKIVIQGSRLEGAARGKQMFEGRYRERSNRPFVVPVAGQSCEQLSGAREVYCADRKRLVRFTGVSVLSVNFSVGTEDDNTQPQTPATREKRPITTEVSPIRRHSTKRERGNPPPREAAEDAIKVRFDEEYTTNKQRKKYIATPSIKRMRRIKRCMSVISLDDFQSSLASVNGSEFESQQYLVPHFTSYSDPMRSGGFRQVLTGKGRRTRTSSLHRWEKYNPSTKAFVERRCSFEADCFIRTGR